MGFQHPRCGFLLQLGILVALIVSSSSRSNSTESVSSSSSDFLLEEGGQGWEEIHWAAFEGDAVLLQELIYEGVDVNLPTADGWTPLV